MRNYIFAGKVNFEGSLNDWDLEWGAEVRRGGRGSEGMKEGRDTLGEREIEEKGGGTLGVEEEAREGGEGAKGGRQLLKAIALPPGRLRRAESVEMLNLA